VREHRQARARHDGIGILTSEVLAVVKLIRVRRRLEFAFDADAVAVAAIGEWRRLDEYESMHGSGDVATEIKDEEMVHLDAQVGVCIARIWFTDNNTVNNHRFLLIVVRGKRLLIKMRLREVVTERAQNRGEDKDKSPARLGHTPGEDDTHNGDTGRNAECKRGQRNASCKPDADEPGHREGDGGHCRSLAICHI
jgi:hypothetical protein